MKNLLKFIFIVLISFFCKAQRTLVEGDFKFVIDKSENDNCEVVKIRIFKNEKLIQTIQQEEFGYNFHFEDMNFDGYKDFRIRKCHFNRYIPYFYWIYNPKKQIFERNKAFEKIVNPEFDTIKNQIIGAYGEETFKLKNNIPIRIMGIIKEESYCSFGGKGIVTKKYNFEKEQMIATWDNEMSLGKEIYKIIGDEYEDVELKEKIVIYARLNEEAKSIYIKEYWENIKGKLELVKEEYNVKREI